MKKYILGLVLSVLVVPSLVGAVEYSSGCTAYSKFSATTGQVCTIITTLSLQQRIDQLVAENNQLKLEIDNLRRLTNSMNTKESKINSQFSSKCLDAKEEILESNEELSELDEKYENIYKKALNKNPDSRVLNSAKYKQELASKKATENASIRQSISTATASMKLYCD